LSRQLLNDRGPARLPNHAMRLPNGDTFALFGNATAIIAKAASSVQTAVRR